MSKERRLRPPPDLQALVASYGNRGFSAIPEAELIAHERAVDEWRAKMRAGELQMIGRVMSDFASVIEPVARLLLGEPNLRLSSRTDCASVARIDVGRSGKGHLARP